MVQVAKRRAELCLMPLVGKYIEVDEEEVFYHLGELRDARSKTKAHEVVTSLKYAIWQTRAKMQNEDINLLK